MSETIYTNTTRVSTKKFVMDESKIYITITVNIEFILGSLLSI